MFSVSACSEEDVDKPGNDSSAQDELVQQHDEDDDDECFEDSLAERLVVQEMLDDLSCSSESEIDVVEEDEDEDARLHEVPADTMEPVEFPLTSRYSGYENVEKVQDVKLDGEDYGHQDEIVADSDNVSRSSAAQGTCTVPMYPLSPSPSPLNPASDVLQIHMDSEFELASYTGSASEASSDEEFCTGAYLVH
ncbi:hypothetical protein K437DRAFT_99548 [Tilletiaria anomala UBC 951]|uniref:Uncharacterized protein n=1 Tax=Tilletiaria anomala (strain ATCC 24038 / CBS 436.72 / UBC 951) TaxID=1037660 RepID=A0A066W0V6_TILAU|nr:uncharacterized protein K437DRAFT_99548 [Tilletiaria anomala UBC 951]KDN47331.1 hypothetical protein K437DRAFT_99548 [Tilletiaria anomala UBC 951]